jgi:hypothetical protein
LFLVALSEVFVYRLDTYALRNYSGSPKIHHPYTLILTSLAQRHNDLLLELIAYNQRTHAAVESLEAHMHRIDSAKTSNIHLRQHARASTLTNQSAFGHRSTTDARSRSPSPDYRGNTEKHARRKGRKDLEIKIPDKKYATAAPALPTPVTHPMVRMHQKPRSQVLGTPSYPNSL